eukprot:CAMPEP_0117428452 /NCGR_PEP_ID=MMETSP0758-20121206/8152_1 /TAXON_ID=63605 /ORGANISM="Percolomonas cosmopolitus, Strain AE-1 (ATCC 50343)" /LENGTH=141 /DNA_ID=CAMNT_0005214807 /DNA_START=1371 /DNA_END=1796 /DNA_ORIENTATION=+
MPQSVHPFFVITTSLSRLAYVWYFWGYEGNFFGIKTQLIVTICLSAWVGIQALILLLQYVFGGRVFIPKWIMPKGYSYYRPIPESAIENGECTCVICLEVVPETEKAMVTPCNHAFHEECLKRWMEEKLECPVCRETIPQI